MRMVSGEENVERSRPVENRTRAVKWTQITLFMVNPTEIDDVLGHVTPSGLPNFQFAELARDGAVLPVCVLVVWFPPLQAVDL
jgi:hypothetical protein